MKHLVTAVLCCMSVSAFADNPLLTFCLNQQPIKEDPRRSVFDLYCPGIVANAVSNQGVSDSTSQTSSSVALSKAETDLAKAQFDLAKVQADAKLAEANSAATALKGLATALKPSDIKLGDLTAFTSAGQRFQADLGYTIGGQIGVALSTAYTTNKIKKGVLLFTSNPDTARQWIQSEDSKAVLADLAIETKHLNDAVETLERCMPDEADEDKAVDFLSFSTSVVLATAGVEAAVALARFVGDALQPKLTAASSVAPPSGLLDAVLSGVFTARYKDGVLGQELIITTSPPIIQGDNPVTKAVKEVSQAANKAADKIEAMKVLKVAKADTAKVAQCIKAAGATVTSAAEAIKAMGVAGSDQVLGSRLDRAARAEASAGLVGIALLTPAASGGAVATYQPRWPRGPRLVTATDLALAYRVQDPNSGAVLTAGYHSKGCGKTLPVSSFTVEYKASDCQSVRGRP